MGGERNREPLAARSTEPSGAPVVPPGRYLRVRNGDRLFVREVTGPAGAPLLVLLHGWCATAGLNWFRAFEPLSEHFHVVAPDLRGHGRGPRGWRRFRLEQCAEDVAALLEELGGSPAVVAGYSMGGPVAQLLWKQHAPLVSGLVMCATGDQLIPGAAERVALRSFAATLAGATRLGTAPVAVPRWLVRNLMPDRGQGEAQAVPGWAAREFRRHDLRMLLEAGWAISQYDASSWTRAISVPTAVLITERDRLVAASTQRALASRIQNGRVFSFEEGHLACTSPDFAEPLVAACLDVATRAEATRPRRRARARG